MKQPYNLMLHYDETVAGNLVHVGDGVLMHPACGQRGEIGVTHRPDLVECTKCRRILDTSGVTA